MSCCLGTLPLSFPARLDTLLASVKPNSTRTDILRYGLGLGVAPWDSEQKQSWPPSAAIPQIGDLTWQLAPSPLAMTTAAALTATSRANTAFASRCTTPGTPG